jgi:2-polyprenyl-3-methyl-5-hydroxy-6-metoxy-1,4-benzoquinol methylase
MLFTSIARRRCAPELMDQPGLDPHAHVQALRGLARINRLSASDRILWSRIAGLAHASPDRVLRVLDIATGGGDVPIRLWRRAQAAKLRIEMFGADASTTAVEHAQKNAQNAGAAVEFFQRDVVRDELPAGFDVITSSLFLHHLHEDQAVMLLQKMARAARRMVLVNDLLRCRTGHLLAWFGGRLLSRSPVVHADAPASVAAAFTMDEARLLAATAGLSGATFEWRWPWRFLLAWSKLP